MIETEPKENLFSAFENKKDAETLETEEKMGNGAHKEEFEFDLGQLLDLQSSFRIVCDSFEISCDSVQGTHYSTENWEILKLSQ